MTETNRDETPDDDAAMFNRRFKYVIVAYALVELVAVVVFIYYRFSHR
ncbi:MAG: hypothetical protein M3268_04160 [Acidobacteriota bacterium]|nr:hypothetical protein [Acidobacteriota bacterium]